jgi:hypothetical protein
MPATAAPAVGAKPWYLSRTIWGVLVALAAQLLARWGYELTPALQGDIVSTILDLVSAGGAGLAVFGRVKASKRLTGPPAPPVKMLVIAGLLGTLALGGPTACAVQEETQTPAQHAYALGLDLVAAQEATIALLDSDADLPPEVIQALVAAEGTAYAAVREYEAAIRANDPPAIRTAAAAAQAAVDYLIHTLSQQGAL